MHSLPLWLLLSCARPITVPEQASPESCALCLSVTEGAQDRLREIPDPDLHTIYGAVEQSTEAHCDQRKYARVCPRIYLSYRMSGIASGLEAGDRAEVICDRVEMCVE